MSNFRNAYHFIPRAARGDYEPLDANHDIYTGSSGRIVCTLTLEQPTVIGARRLEQPGDYARLQPFSYKGRPAIPATSLKGLISSLAEAASLSPYRVLKDEPLTVRHRIGQQADARARPGRVHDYVDPKLLPCDSEEGGNREFGLAERMFGFVAKKEEGQEIAVAGRIRPTLGLLDGDWAGKEEDELFLDRGKWVVLKELSQPMKGWPSGATTPTHRSATPNFYFRRKDGDSARFISKRDFAKGGKDVYEIQGQKAYLHHLLNPAPDKIPWKTAATRAQDRASGAVKRKSEVRPLAKGVEFRFVLDFDNLTDEMLDLLCFALRPSPRFRHKIGFGKPLGLGSVRIDPVELQLVNRESRYGEQSIFGERAAEMLGHEAIGARADRHRRWLEERDAAALRALLLIGETHDFDGRREEPPVLWVPLSSRKHAAIGTDEAENQSFEWFANNDASGEQRLMPIGADTKDLPVLRTNERQREKKGDQRQSRETGRHGHSGGTQRSAPRGASAPAQQIVQRNLRGKVETLTLGRGTILFGADDRIFFDRASAGAAFDRLAKGDEVSFDVVTRPGGEQLATKIRVEE